MPLSAHLPDPEPLNMTPMIDVVFNLLVFFLLSALFYAEERELELSVPTVNSAKAVVSGPEDIIINVNEDGRVTMNSRLYDATQLEVFLEKCREQLSRPRSRDSGISRLATNGSPCSLHL